MTTSFNVRAKPAHSTMGKVKKVIIIFETITDFDHIETKVFVLPDKAADFRSLINVFDSKNAIEPVTLTKKLFQDDFINYTTKQLFTDSTTPGKLNARYEKLFKIPSLHNDLQANFEALQQLQASFETQMAQTVENYKKAKSNEPSPPPGTPIKKGMEEIEVPPTKPSSKSQKPKVNFPGGLSEEELKTYNTLPKGIKAKLSGFAGDKLLEATPFWRQYAGEVVMNNKNNAWVVLGRDFGKPGMDGSTGAGAVWICAGLSPHDTDMETKDSIHGAEGNTLKQKRSDLISDAAFLYLSQKCDTDTLFPGTAGGTYSKRAGPRVGESAAVLKADGVAIIARKSGIRFITGTDKKSTSGGQVSAKFGIDLIAGNDDSDLQSMVKGENLITYLAYLSETISDLGGVVYKVITDSVKWKASVMTHRHYDPVAIGLGGLAGVPFGIFGGQNIPSMEIIQSGTESVLNHLLDQMSEINRTFKGINNDLNALQKIGSYSIRSGKNRVN